MASNRSKDSRQKRKRLGGIQELRTAVKARLRSKPETEGQEHLDMYVLTRDRARWGRLERQSGEAIEEIEKEMEKMEKTLPGVEHTQDEDHRPEPPRKRSGKKFGTFRVDY